MKRFLLTSFILFNLLQAQYEPLLYQEGQGGDIQKQVSDLEWETAEMLARINKIRFTRLGTKNFKTKPACETSLGMILDQYSEWNDDLFYTKQLLQIYYDVMFIPDVYKNDIMPNDASMLNKVQYLVHHRVKVEISRGLTNKKLFDDTATMGLAHCDEGTTGALSLEFMDFNKRADAFIRSLGGLDIPAGYYFNNK